MIIVTLDTPEISAYSNISIETKKEYCARHGYRLVRHEKTLCESRHPSWSKIVAVQKAMEDTRWIFWIDADAMVMNITIPLTRFVDTEKDVIVCRDRGGNLNMGVFFMRNCEWSKEFLRQVWDYRDKNGTVFHGPGRPWEQRAVNDLCAREDIVGHFDVRETSEFNEEPHYFRTGQFILHYIVKDPATRAKYMKRMLPKIVR